MRAEFAAWVEAYTTEHSEAVFLTGDLGFMALESLRNSMGPRFINAGVSEQNMLAMAAGLASEGLTPFCYSIAPFAVFRAAEQSRIDVCLHRRNVKIIGNGGGYGYGIMGATHHAIEDLAFMSSLQHMRCFLPAFNEDVANVCNAMMKYNGPSYLRLNIGAKPDDFDKQPYATVRRFKSGDRVTVITCGPTVINANQALLAIEQVSVADLFSISELPCVALTPELVASIQKTRKVVIIEEQVSRGGLAENLSLLILKQGLPCRMTHVCATGYPNGLYGSQLYHQKISGLDAASLVTTLQQQIEAPRV